MAKKPSIVPVVVPGASDNLNQNFQTIADQFDNLVSRDGSVPNQMESDLDLNSNDLLNVKSLNVEGLIIQGQDLGTAIEETFVARDEAVQAAGEADAARDEAVSLVSQVDPIYDSYNDFITANIPSPVIVASATVGGVLVSWRRDPAGPNGPTADGGMWRCIEPTTLTLEDKTVLASLDADAILPLGTVATVSGVDYYKMPSTHPQFGTNPLADIPGWISATSVSGELIRANWNISQVFAGGYKALYTDETTDTTTHPGARTTRAISRVVTGSGENGPGRADSALHVMVKKSDIYGDMAGEIDALRINTFQDGVSDCGGALIGAWKKIGDGTAAEGAVTTAEASMRRYTTDVLAPTAVHQAILGFSPSPASVWNGRDAIGFYSDNRVGSAFANFLGVADSDGLGNAPTKYLIAGFRDRSQDEKFFSVEPDGTIEVASYNAGPGAGPTITRKRDSGSPAANDILSEDVYDGKNDIGEDVTYARTYAAIKDVADGTEDGIYRIFTSVSGALTRQFSAENGVSIGPTSTHGTGTLNTNGSILVGGTTVIDSSRGVRFPPYGAANIADAAHAVNTTDKVAGKAIFDTANGRVLVASGGAATDPWNLMDGTVAVNPS